MVAKVDCRLLFLDRLTFKRVLGPLENILKRNSDAYVKYVKKDDIDSETKNKKNISTDQADKFKQTSVVRDCEEIVESDPDSESDNEENQKFAKMIAQKRLAAAKAGRKSVSAEVYGEFNKKAKFEARVIPKNSSQKSRIVNKVSQSFLFSSLDDKEMNTVIDAFEEKRFSKGEYVIKQGEQGDVLFLIESGTLNCYKTFNKEEGDKFLKAYNPGEAFGELALLYNAPRAASIIASNDCILWALDRETFNNIVKEAAVRKREKYQKFLKSVDIFSSIELYELSQICDALQVQKCEEGSYIISQNDPGDKFYIIEKGEAFATKVFEQGGEAKVVKEYTKGGYFGELALI